MGAARIELAGLQPGGEDGDVNSIFFSPAAWMGVAAFRPAIEDVVSNFSPAARIELAGLQSGGEGGNVVSIFFFRRRPGWGGRLPASNRGRCFHFFSPAARIELAGLQPGGVDGDVVSIFFSPAARMGVAGFQPTFESEISRLVKF